MDLFISKPLVLEQLDLEPDLEVDLDLELDLQLTTQIGFHFVQDGLSITSQDVHLSYLPPEHMYERCTQEC